MSLVLVNADTVARMRWIAEQLKQARDAGWIRYEGETVFIGAQNELADILANAQEPVTVAAPPVFNVMTAEQVAAMGETMSSAIALEVLATISAPASAEAPAP